MGSGKITKNRINLDLIKIFQFYLKFDICGDSLTMGGCMYVLTIITHNPKYLD